jgi:hypothetical protein
MTYPKNHPILHKLNISQVAIFTLEKLSFCLDSHYSLHHSLLSQTDSSKWCSGPTHDECFIRKYCGEDKKKLAFLPWYHFTYRSLLGANFPKGNDTWFFICKKLPFSLDSTSYCSIILFFSCKWSHLNVLFTKFSQFSIHLISGKGIYSFLNRYRSPLIHLIPSLHHSNLLSQTDWSKCCFGPNYDVCFIWNTYWDEKNGFSILGIIYLDEVRSEQTSQKEMIPGYSNPNFFSFSLDSPDFFFVSLLSPHKLSTPNVLLKKLT